ncbi:hypothetical protein LBMAG56_34530 [Verrucomicrobiota bacterium]|nr:hypothetical protein LBMAG56_34530 [Verrucomicrobiota bacterium]
MKPKVYIETTVVSYLTARATRDPIVAGNMRHSKNWWENERGKFDVYVSDAVIVEASEGDRDAVRRRMAFLSPLPALVTDNLARELARFVMASMVLPAKAEVDALHLAIAAVNGMDYLLTWNCRHLNNAFLKPKLEGLCQARGYVCPNICTPAELIMGD